MLGVPWGRPWSYLGVAGRVLGGAHERTYAFLAALETNEKPLVFIMFSAIGRARGCPGGSLGKRWGSLATPRRSERLLGDHLGSSTGRMGSKRGSFEGL